MSKTVLITGCSSGLGRALANAAAQRGYEVAATARKIEDIVDLEDRYPGQVRTFTLDVSDNVTVRDAVQAAYDAFGRIDVLINNAGYGLLGALEDLSDEQICEVIDVNLFGPTRVIRAALPFLRMQKSGVIVNISAIAALANHAGFSVYGAAKAAVEALGDGLQAEMNPLGIKIMSVEPGPFRTDFICRSLRRAEETRTEYAPTVGKFGALLTFIDGKQTGDPTKAAEAIFQAVESPNPPSRLVLGKYAYNIARQRFAQLTRELDQWEAVGAATDFA